MRPCAPRLARPRWLWALALAASALLAAPVLAHDARLSRGELRARGDHVECSLRFAAADLRAAGLLPPTVDGSPQPLAGQLAGPALGQLFTETVGMLELRTSGRCTLEPGATAVAEDDDGVELHARFACPAGRGRLEGDARYLERLGAAHTQLLQIFLDGAEFDRVLQAESPGFTVDAAAPASSTALRFFGLGVEHIFTGGDHLAFLLALLLLGGSLGTLVRIVTAFTVAHSLTLALAALGVLTLSPRIVEPLVAASIAAVAAENLWALRLDAAAAARALRHRWLVTFGFGLIHGFGFAGALREVGLPRDHLPLALAMFNLGVEAGQVCVVAAALPLLTLLRRRKWFAANGPRVLSAALGAAGLVWLVQRL
jgi:HupE / UreJ protein